MFPDELEVAFVTCPMLYLPYGLCEPHGPHSAVGLDALKAHAICVRAAREYGGIVAPADYWHIHEIGGYAVWAAECVGEPQRAWMSAMPPWQHFRNVLYHIRQADVLGFKGAILFTGHYGPNWKDLNTLIELVQPYVGTRLYGLPDFEANVPGFDDPGGQGDHAGKVETSLLWAVEPDCIDTSRFPPPGVPGPHFAMGDDAREADRRIGERMVDDEVLYLGAKARELLADYDRRSPQHTLLTYADVEQVWADVVRPQFDRFVTLQQYWSPDGSPGEEPPTSSMWRRNWAIPHIP
jgi:creatinine amidohydrolase